MESYKDVKIGVYAICSGEPNEFIDRWLASMSKADYIWVLVTKLNDPNYAYFKEKQKLDEFKDKLFVAEKEIRPWRFDVARNESMALVDKPCNALICTDIDEVLIEDFWDDYRKVVFEHPNFERVYYQFAWKHDSESGEPTTIFWYDKTQHKDGYKWHFAVHEALLSEADKYGYNGQYFLDEKKIYLHHYPDKNKTRAWYFDLLKLRNEENERDVYGYYYLAREYTFYGDWLHCLKALLPLYNLLSLPKELKTPEVARASEDPFMYAATCIMAGNSYARLGILDEAEKFFVKAINASPTLVDGYICLAQLYAYSNRPQQSRDVLSQAQKNCKKLVDWRIRLYRWRAWKWLQIQADALSWEGKYEEAMQVMLEAEKDIKTTDDKAFATAEQFYIDKAFIEKHLQNKGVSYEK